MTREEVIESLEFSMRDKSRILVYVFVGTLKQAVKLLKEQPEQKTGHWEKSDYADDNKWHKCSECGTITEKVDKYGYKLICNYCRICGAKMDKKNDRKTAAIVGTKGEKHDRRRSD